jgi:hypothetical protein
MQKVSLVITAIFFLYMAYTAFFKPKNIYRSLGFRDIPNDAINETLGVYGGFGLVIGVLLLYSLSDSVLAGYVQFVVGLSLLGMALGRLSGFFSITKITGKFPKIYFLAEMMFGAISILAWYFKG